MTNGRPPKPIERKRALGNPGKRPLPVPSVLLAGAIDVPEPLRPLGSAGAEMWNRTWEAGNRWISPQTDIELLQMVCEQIDERIALRIRVLTKNRVEERRSLRDLDKQIVQSMALLGFTPADRSRLGLAEVKAVSKLDELARRRGTG